MNILNAIRLLKETCAQQRTALNNEKTLLSLASLAMQVFKDSQDRTSGDHQPKLNPIVFDQHAPKQEIGKVGSLRGKRPAALRHYSARNEVSRLLAQLTYTYSYRTRLIVYLIYACAWRVRNRLTSGSRGSI